MSLSNITPDQVTIGRLRKRINKLVLQRDHFKELNKHYSEVLNVNPIIENRFEKYADYRKERDRIKALETRVKEQEILIKRLTENYTKTENS